MLIKNRKKDAIPSELNLKDFAHAMKQMDMSNVAPEKKKQAVFDHFMSVMAGSVRDPEMKFEILMSQRLRRKNV